MVEKKWKGNEKLKDPGRSGEEERSRGSNEVPVRSTSLTATRRPQGVHTSVCGCHTAAEPVITIYLPPRDALKANISRA